MTIVEITIKNSCIGIEGGRKKEHSMAKKALRRPVSYRSKISQPREIGVSGGHCLCRVHRQLCFGWYPMTGIHGNIDGLELIRCNRTRQSSQAPLARGKAIVTQPGGPPGNDHCKKKRNQTHALPMVLRDWFGNKRMKAAHDASQHLNSSFQDFFERRGPAIHGGRRLQMVGFDCNHGSC